MDLITRCPQCGTTFSASLEQLQLRKGYIRCINCAHIFDGYDAVVSADGAPSPATHKAPARESEPSVFMPSVVRQRPAEPDEPVHTITPLRASGQDSRFTISDKPQVPESGPAQKPVFHVGGDGIRVRPDPALGAARVAPVTTEPDTAAVGGPRPQVYVEPRQEGGRARPPEFMRERTGASGAMRLFWRVLVLLGIVLLLAQLTYIYRVQIANNVPVLRPALERACASLDCKIPYARKIDQVAIMSSSLRSGSGAIVGEGAAQDDQGQPVSDTMLLQLTLRNTYDKSQEWPTLVLDLTDFSGALVVRKNLPPQSYLPLDIMRQPFQAGSEVTVSVPIVLNGLKINGYQLDKFFQ